MDLLSLLNPFPAAIVPNSSIPFLLAMLVFLLYGLFRLRPVWRDAGSFAKAAASLRQAAKRSPFRSGTRLASLWADFVERYNKGKVTTAAGTFGVVEPQDVFTESAVLGSYNRQLSLALAGIFAGLGILGTFTGLYLGLQDISIQDQDRLFESVETLLGGMSTAFITSLFGIALSISWLLVDRWLHHRLQHQARGFFAEVRSTFPVLSAGAVLLQSLQAAEDQRVLLDEQKGILQNLGTDIATAVQEAMDKSFSPALKSIDETLQAVTTNVDEKQAEALDELVGAFREELLGATNEQFEQLSKAIQGAAEWQERVNDDVQEVFTRIVSMSEMSVDLIEKSGDAAGRFLESLSGLRESHERISEVTRNLHEIADRTAATSHRLGEQASAFAEANTDLRTALASQLDEIRGQVDRLAGFWTELQGDLDGLATGLEGSLSEFTSLTQEKLREIFSRFDSEMATVVNHLSGTLAELREATEEIVPGVQRIEEAIGESLAPVRASEQKLTALTESILSLGPLPDSLRDATAQAREVREAMGRLQTALENHNGEGGGGRGGGLFRRP